MEHRHHELVEVQLPVAVAVVLGHKGAGLGLVDGLAAAGAGEDADQLLGAQPAAPVLVEHREGGAQLLALRVLHTAIISPRCAAPATTNIMFFS